MEKDSFLKCHFPCCVMLETIHGFRIKSEESSNLWLQTSLSSPQNRMVPQTDISREPSIGDLVQQECRSPQETLPPNPVSSTPWQPLKSGSNRSHQFDSLSAVCVLYDVWVSVSSVGRSLVISIKVKSFLRLPVSAALFSFYSRLSFISLRTISFIWHSKRVTVPSSCPILERV